VSAVLVAVLAAGCGGDDGSPPSATKARDTVLRFLHAGADGHRDSACALLEPEVVGDIRHAVLASYRAAPGTPAQRLAQVRAFSRRTRSCDDALRAAFAAAGPRVDAVSKRAAKARLKWLTLFEGESAASLDNDEWVVREHDGRWRIAAANALVDALP
jgi:hypothetical protein